MASDPNEVHSETDAARAGSTPHIVRWVLGISLFAAIALLSIIWITGAATQGENEDEVSVTAQYHDPVREDTAGTDSIVGEDADEIETAEPGDEEAPGVPTVENEAD